MSRPLALLTVDHVLTIHRRVIAEFGGGPGLRSRALLESAVAMPAARFAGRFLHRTIAAKAAAYHFHLASNHPFVDGNKRTALAAAETFLELNGYRLSATDEELESLTLGVAAGTISKHDVLAFFQRHAVK